MADKLFTMHTLLMSVSLSSVPKFQVPQSATLISKESTFSCASFTGRTETSIRISSIPCQFSKFVHGRKNFAVKAAASPVVEKKSAAAGRDDRVIQIHTVEEFDTALVDAKSKLVVVEYAAIHSENSKKIYPAMVDLSRTCQDTVFLLVLGDETEATKELCMRAGIEKVGNLSLSFCRFSVFGDNDSAMS